MAKVTRNDWEYDDTHELLIADNDRPEGMEVTFFSKGDLEVWVRGYGGYDCSSHTCRTDLTREQAIDIRDFLNKYLIGNS